MKKTKILSFLVVTAILTSLLVGCAEKKTSVATPKETDAPKRELKMLIPYQPFDPNLDKSALMMQELTGYKVNYFMLPQKNPDEKLMLEISSGNDYDIIRVTPTQFGSLAATNCLTEIDTLIDKYGANIQKNVPDYAWQAVTANNKKIGIPRRNTAATMKNAQGMLMGGVLVRTDLLAKLGLKMPTNIDELTNMLKKFKENGFIPLAGSSAIDATISSAFGFQTNDWYDVNNGLVPRIKMPGAKDYLTFMANSYKDGLLDKDWPINKMENQIQKFTTGKAAAMPCMFWDLPSVIPALEKNVPGATTQMMLPLYGEDGKQYLTIGKGSMDIIDVIPKSAKNPIDAVKFCNLKADSDIFLKTYLGKEGVSFKIENGKYLPILPAFNDYANSNQFTGVGDGNKVWAMWQARARKTPEMAAAYDQLNAIVPTVANGLHEDITPSANLEAIRKNNATLNQLESNFMIKVIAGAVPVSDIDKFITQWSQQGGADMEKAINDWYKQNQDLKTK